MFGIKFRSWMESHIVRPKKKQRAKDATGNAGTGSGNTTIKGKNGKTIPGSITLDTPASPISTKIDDNTQSLHCNYSSISVHNGNCSKMDNISLLTRNHHVSNVTCNNLSSPESAYSTGYSTDGTSPGAGAPFAPPEYYINIRTGTHYFLPNATTSTTIPQITTTRPSNQPYSVHFSPTAFQTSVPINSTFQSNTQGNFMLPPGHCRKQSNSPFTGTSFQTAFTKRTTFDKTIPKALEVITRTHRRTESCDESRRILTTDIPTPPLTNAQLTSSPRQRTRIRTNPWLSTNTLNASNPGTSCSSSSILKHRNSTTESLASSSSGFKRGFAESSSSHGSSSDKLSPRMLCARGIKELDCDNICSSSSTSSCLSISNASDITDDDLTLNEMMGKFDESYVYEKETDILSDSDPTDCDETDFEAGQEGGDERDTQDEEEFDFIDNGSLLELPLDIENADNPSNPLNKGHCTYHDFVRKPRFRESFNKRLSNRGSPVLKRANACESPTPLLLNRRSSRDSSKYRKHESNSNNLILPTVNQTPSNSKSSSEKKKTRNSIHKSVRQRNLQSRNRADSNFPTFYDKVNSNDDCESGLNFNRVLMQRMLSRTNEIGTRSAGNTPLSSRKKTFSKEGRCSPNARFPINNETNLDTVSLNYNIQKKRSNSVSYAQSIFESTSVTGSSYMTSYEADKEADLKYKQLIQEAEHILITMKDNIPAQTFKHLTPKPNIFTRKLDLDNGYMSPKVERKDYSNELIESGCKSSTCSPKSTLSRDSITSAKQGIKIETSEIGKANNKGRIASHQDSLIDHFKAEKANFLPEASSYNDHQGTLFSNRSSQGEECQKDEKIFSKRKFFHQSSFERTQKELKECENPVERQGVGIRMTKSPTLNGVSTARSKPSLVAFRSVDLGNELDGSNYCPQSEPVKRKVYTCSATFDRLQKSLVEKSRVGKALNKQENTEDGNRNSLRQKLEQLRREDKEQNHLKELSPGPQNQHHLSIMRRQMLVNTIESLKRSLEDQSAKLKATYVDVKNTHNPIHLKDS